jgi:hypothetical protein
MQTAARAAINACGVLPGYFREPRCGFFNCDWRILAFFRLGLLITKVPLPKYSALKSLSSGIIDPSLLIPRY